MSNLTTYKEARMTLKSLLAQSVALRKRPSAESTRLARQNHWSPTSTILELSPDDFAQIMAEARNMAPSD